MLAAVYFHFIDLNAYAAMFLLNNIDLKNVQCDFITTVHCVAEEINT